jgi:hypothetical protein
MRRRIIAAQQLQKERKKKPFQKNSIKTSYEADILT